MTLEVSLHASYRQEASGGLVCRGCWHGRKWLPWNKPFPGQVGKARSVGRALRCSGQSSGPCPHVLRGLGQEAAVSGCRLPIQTEERGRWAGWCLWLWPGIAGLGGWRRPGSSGEPCTGCFPGGDQSPLAGGGEAGPDGPLPGDPRQVRPLRQGEHWPAALPQQDRLQEPEPHLERGV